MNGVTSMKMAKCLFRPSQIKFQAKAISGDQIEMVKFSSAVLVALNKPFINILDQVSEMQSLDCHKRITSRIEELMDRQILSFAKQMNEETFCRNKLKVCLKHEIMKLFIWNSFRSFHVVLILIT